MAATGVWALCWAHINLRKLLPIPNGEPISKCQPDGIRDWIPMAQERVEPPPCAKESPPHSDEELTPLSQAERNAAGTAAGSPKKTRTRREATRSLACRIFRLFPFCW